MSVNVFPMQCPAGRWGLEHEMDRYVSLRCCLEVGHRGPCKLVGQLAHLRERKVSNTDRSE